MNICFRTTTNSLLFSQQSYACEERINTRRLNEKEDNNNEILFGSKKIVMSTSCSSDLHQEDSLSRAKEVIAQARTQRRSPSSPRRRNAFYEPHTSISTQQRRKEKETAMLLEEIMLVKQKILIDMKKTKTPNADRDTCIQSFLQACDAFARVYELEDGTITKNNERRVCLARRKEERKTRVKFDMSKNEVFLF